MNWNEMNWNELLWNFTLPKITCSIEVTHWFIWSDRTIKFTATLLRHTSVARPIADRIILALTHHIIIPIAGGSSRGERTTHRSVGALFRLGHFLEHFLLELQVPGRTVLGLILLLLFRHCLSTSGRKCGRGGWRTLWHWRRLLPEMGNCYLKQKSITNYITNYFYAK